MAHRDAYAAASPAFSCATSLVPATSHCRADNLASGALPGFRDLDIRPKAIEDIVPTYIGRLRQLRGWSWRLRSGFGARMTRTATN
jgi:hypothetical protein